MSDRARGSVSRSPLLTTEQPSTAVRSPESWRMSPTLFGAVVVGGLGLLTALVLRRPDVLVLALPFVAYAVWAVATRPSHRPATTVRIGTRTLFERQQTQVTVELVDQDPGAAWVSVAEALDPRVHWTPASGVLSERVRPGRHVTTLGLGAGRWGIVDLTGVRVALTSSLAAWRLPMAETSGTRLKVLPRRDDFGAVDAVPRPAGLVGLHASRRPGSSGELAGVRAFQSGDRLRRINWRVSSRTDDLHVNATWSERDTEVQLWVDSRDDLGPTSLTAARDGASTDAGAVEASSLDTAVRAAAAVAEHYLRHGDRVSVVDLGAGGATVSAGSGRAHLRRILDALVTATPLRVERIRPPRIRPGSLVVALTPLLDDAVAARLVEVVQQGSSAIVVDTLPIGLGAGGGDTGAAPDLTALAWRLRRAARLPTVHALASLGIPFVAWRGAGTLDEVLRDVSRMAAAPRIVR